MLRSLHAHEVEFEIKEAREEVVELARRSSRARDLRRREGVWLVRKFVKDRTRGMDIGALVDREETVLGERPLRRSVGVGANAPESARGTAARSSSRGRSPRAECAAREAQDVLGLHVAVVDATHVSTRCRCRRVSNATNDLQ